MVRLLGSLLRIQRAFAYGAGQLEKLLHSTSTNVHLAERLATFFRNTQKHCRGLRPDAFSSIELCQQVNAASLCDDKASSASANTEVTAEKVVVEHAQFLPSCNGAQAQRAVDFDNDELHQRLKGIKKCMKNANFHKFPKVSDLTASSDDDDTHKAGGTGIFGKDPCSWSLQDLKTSRKRLERRKSDTSSTQTNLCRLLAGSMTHLFLYTTIVASAKGLANCDSSLCDHAFYDHILKTKLQSKALSSSIFRVTLSLLPWILSKIEVQQEGNACIVHLGMQLKKNSPQPIIHCKSRSLFPSGSQGSLLQEDQFTRLTKKTEVDILRGDLATYLLNLESARCTPKSCLQDPLLHESRTKKCSLPVEQESALEGPGNPKAVAPPISAPNAMPMSDLLAEGSRKPCKETGAFSPNLVYAASCLIQLCASSIVTEVTTCSCAILSYLIKELSDYYESRERPDP